MNNVKRTLWGLVGAGLAWYVALSVWLSFSAIFFPYALDYGEGDVFWFTRKLAHGEQIYITLQGPPFDAANYPPLAMLLTASLYPLFGDSLIFGRWLNFAAAALATAFIARWVKSETRNGRAALLAAAFFLGSTFVYHWMPLYRVDLMGVAFSLAGIFLVWKWEWNDRRRTTDDRLEQRRMSNVILIFAIVFFLLSLYTKHSLFFAPAAAALAILLRDRRAGVVFALGLGASGGAIFLALEMWTRGGWSFGILALNATVWTPRVFVPLVASFVTTYAIVLLLGAFGWWTRVRRSKNERGEKKFGVLEMYALASLFSIVLAGREGAWENYFLEVIVMACVFAGMALSRFVPGPSAKETKGIWQISVPVFLLLQLALFWNEHDPRIAQKLFDDTRAGNAHVAPLVRNAQGTVISEDMSLLWRNGKRVEYYSFVYSTLARAGRYDQKWETENLRAGNFPLVILKRGTRENVDAFGNFTRAFVSALDYGYAVSSRDALYVVYEPAPLEHLEPRTVFGETFELVGWALEPQALRAGDDMQLTVLWRALKKPAARYTLFAQLAKVDGGNIAQDDHEPHNGAYPTTHWAEDELVRETIHLQIPPEIATGEYVLRIGWYDTLTQENLGIAGGADMIELKKFLVK